MPLQRDAPFVAPIRNTDEIVRAWDSFKDLKLRLLNDSDFVLVKGERYAKKSAFRKLALAFGISVEIVREDRIDFKTSTAFLITAKAISPNGRFMTAVGSCHTDEKKFSKASDARAVAQTRATNRAVADLIGWSTPSAEEMIGEEVEEPTASYALKQEVPSIGEHPSTKQTDHENTMSSRQRSLLISLINQRIVDQEEREEALVALENYDKRDASDAIKAFLNPA
jgi:hypothetical protein